MAANRGSQGPDLGQRRCWQPSAALRVSQGLSRRAVVLPLPFPLLSLRPYTALLAAQLDNSASEDISH